MQIASFLAMTKTGKLQRLWDSSSRWLAGRKPRDGGALKRWRAEAAPYAAPYAVGALKRHTLRSRCAKAAPYAAPYA